MEWSYSRINSFSDCPYGWFLKYILGLPKTPNFYSQYGKFMHTILQKYFNGELKKRELVSYYVSRFEARVTMRPQRDSTYIKYYQDGLDYLSWFSWKPCEVLGVEREVTYLIGGKPARGFIDLEENDGGIILTDHKSADIKPKSTRKKPTKDDIKLDEMFRQLYLYSKAVYKDYGKYPKLLRFNPFRNDEFIEEPFSKTKLEETENWAINQIEVITNNESWYPNIDYFYCNFLCDMRENCEYYKMNRGD